MTHGIETVEDACRAIGAIPDNHSDRGGQLHKISLDLDFKYSRTGQIIYLEEAIRIAQLAIDATAEEHPKRAERLSDFHHYLISKYNETYDQGDFEFAIQVARQAVNASQEDDPNRSLYLTRLGLALIRGDVDQNKEGRIHLQSAWDSRTGRSSIITQIVNDRQLLRDHANNSDWERAYEAATTSVRLIRELASRSLDNFNKQFILSQVSSLSSDAAATALYTAKEPLVALSFLELGRGVLAASIEDMSENMESLQDSYPELAEKYFHLQGELEFSPTIPTFSVSEGRTSSFATQAARRHVAVMELDKLISEYHRQSGFDDLFDAPSEHAVLAAAEEGPIVIINVSEYRCDAILVERHKIWSLELPKLHIRDIQSKTLERDLKSSSVLRWLWDVAAGPVLEALGFDQAPCHDSKYPHVWWIPTGPLTKFPLHSAGYHSKGSFNTVLDRVMSSYSSSVKMMIRSRQRAGSSEPSSQDQALLVPIRYTTGYSELRAAPDEVAIVRGLCKPMSLEPIEPGRCKQDVVSSLPNCKVFHFAGHGMTDSEDPSNSQLLFEEGETDSLTITELWAMNLRKSPPFLAYLSACGTGQVNDVMFSDESIHLISAFQLAGFRHVIGTLWEVNDALCVDMARLTYEGICNGSMSDESVCKGLHTATKELRDRWLNDSEAIFKRKKISESSMAISSKDETSISLLPDGDQVCDHLSRKPFLSCQDRDQQASLPLHWVPYVHFGV